MTFTRFTDFSDAWECLNSNPIWSVSSVAVFLSPGFEHQVWRTLLYSHVLLDVHHRSHYSRLWITYQQAPIFPQLWIVTSIFTLLLYLSTFVKYLKRLFHCIPKYNIVHFGGKNRSRHLVVKQHFNFIHYICFLWSWIHRNVLKLRNFLRFFCFPRTVHRNILTNFFKNYLRT